VLDERPVRAVVDHVPERDERKEQGDRRDQGNLQRRWIKLAPRVHAEVNRDPRSQADTEDDAASHLNPDQSSPLLGGRRHPRGLRADQWQDHVAGAGKTRYTARAMHWSAEARNEHEETGFHEGWGKAADQLEVLARTL
jgi:hypothetical protein